MADKPSKPKTKNRLVKNPDTFRERAIKAAETSAKPSRFARVKSKSDEILRLTFGPTFRVIRKIFNRQPFKLIGKFFKLIGKVLLPTYVRNSWKELKLVTWPNWKQSRSLTSAVLIFAIVFGAAIAIVDYGLDKLFRTILLK